MSISPDHKPTDTSSSTPHSGDLGMEYPLPEARSIHDGEVNTAIGSTADLPVELRVSSTPEKSKKWYKHPAVIVGGAVLSAVGVTASIFGIKMASDMNEALAPLKEPGAAAPAVPGEDAPEQAPIVSTPTLETPPYEFDDMTYAEAWEPAQLTEDQMAAWNSGDQNAMSDVFSQVMATRIGYALEDISRAGEAADVSFVTTDPAVKDKLSTIVSTFDTNVPGETPFAFNVCRTDIQYDEYSRCNPANLPEVISLIPADGDKAVWAIARYTNEDQFADQSDANAAILHLEVAPEVSSTGLMTLVAQ